MNITLTLTFYILPYNLASGIAEPQNDSSFAYLSHLFVTLIFPWSNFSSSHHIHVSFFSHLVLSLLCPLSCLYFTLTLHLLPSFTPTFHILPFHCFCSILSVLHPLSLCPSMPPPSFHCPLIISPFLISLADSSGAGPFSHRLLIRRKKIRKATLYPANGEHA